MSAPTEATPLLASASGASNDLQRKGLFSPYHRVLIATFLLSTTFWFTATPILYAYRIFNCQEYYASPTHPSYTGTGDACAIPAIETSTAKDISAMVILSTFSGTVNLLFTTWQIRNWGLRAAIVQQTCWPAVRNLTQIYATLAGGRLGITIMTATQLITILGGGAGYLLSANSYIAEVVPPAERTGAFGVLAGVSMLGTALGYVAGGLANDLIGIVAPFEIAFVLLVASTLYTLLFLPYVPPAARSEAEVGATKKRESVFAFLDCLRVFLPAKYESGRGTFYGVTLLGLGAFAGGLATAYVPMMLQLAATNQYGYKASDNGVLMSAKALSRAAFLTFAFPRIIRAGRIWFAGASESNHVSSEDGAANANGDEALTPGTAAAAPPTKDPPPCLPSLAPRAPGSAFDLAFLRWSMLVDALLTALVACSSQSWHMLAAAAILPLASGTAPACKGVLMDMVPASRRADALAAIALVDTLALICTVSLFGALFAALSALGRANLVFVCNAGVALLAAAVLFAVKFPRGAIRAASH
ncbi:hypothetical protein FB451DRAFT_1046793 [Mycena latifolia]|nr:hypothetical protein FB451DRAFT_1046793 [Mycena latifolia]